MNGGVISGPSNPATVTIAAPPDVPCTVSAEGANVVMVGSFAEVVFKAVPGDGQWDSNSIKITGPKNISTKVLFAAPTTMRVRVKGEKKSKKIGDTTFEASYICKDKSKKTATWTMTVIGKEDKAVSLVVVAVPPQPESVNIGTTREFDFVAFPPITIDDVVTSFTSLSDDGDVTGTNSGDVNASTPDALPQETDSIHVEVDGVKNSRRIDDVTVSAEAQAKFTLDGVPSTAKGTGRKAFTVGPLRDHEDSCHWTVSGPSGIAIPEKEKKVETQVLEFEAAAENTGKLKWRSLLTPNPSPGVTVHIVSGLNSPKMKVQVTVQASAFPSLSNGDTTISCQYECEKNPNEFEFGVATHTLTLFRLTKE